MTPRSILLGFGEALGAIESAWMLRDAGVEVHVFARSGARSPLARARGIQVHEVTSPAVDHDATITDVISLTRRLSVEVVMPLDDEGLWVIDAAGAELEAKVAGPTGPMATLALDKRAQISAAHQAGFTVPETVVVGPGERPASLPASRDGWVVKPALAVEEREGRLARGQVVIALSPDRVDLALRATVHPMLVQPRILGVGCGVFGLADGCTAAALSGHRRVRMMNPAGSGSSACIATEPLPRVVRNVSRLVAHTGWNGMFMVELLEPRDGSEPIFMELNGRVWGSMALARRRGLVYPVWAAQAAVGQPVALNPGVVSAPESGDSTLVARHLGRELLHLAFVARGPHSRPDPSWPSRWRTLREVLWWRRGDVLYNYRRGEARTLAADTWQTLARQRERLLGRTG